MSSARSRSSTDPLSAALDAAVVRVLADVAATPVTNPVVLIDGRSGAGKTSLTRRLVERWPDGGRVQMLALDSVYPGWDGLRRGADYVRERVLAPHARGAVGVWRRWDWEAHERAEASEIEPALPLIVEGAGVLTPETALLAGIRVWVGAPDAERRRRALDRDGDAYRPHWERWAAQEAAHLAEHDPVSLASVVIDLP